ncbi:MAG: hypothetical protein JWR65_5246 [Massilia sp.]|nr:hypothetical protein [Massilia sp.]
MFRVSLHWRNLSASPMILRCQVRAIIGQLARRFAALIAPSCRPISARQNAAVVRCRTVGGTDIHFGVVNFVAGVDQFGERFPGRGGATTLLPCGVAAKLGAHRIAHSAMIGIFMCRLSAVRRPDGISRRQLPYRLDKFTHCGRSWSRLGNRGRIKQSRPLGNFAGNFE